MTAERKNMTEREKSLRDLVDKTLDFVDSGMFSRSEKQEILREVRGSLIEMRKIIASSPDITTPPSGGQNPA